MPSTFTSDSVLAVEGLNMVFHAHVYRSWTWRDLFTNIVKDPISSLISEKDRLHILQDINLQIKEGERVGILGVNATGKTTLCRLIAGMYAPTSGKITVKGDVRAIFDTSVGIQPELTGRENALLLAEFMYPNVENREKIVDEALEFSELGRFLNMPYRLYSNGMQSRLCLSLVSGQPCDLLILDEVFEGADISFKQKISARILRMIHNSGAVIFVSHSNEQIQQVCDRAIVLHLGKIGFDGKPKEAIKYYDSIRPKNNE